MNAEPTPTPADHAAGTHAADERPVSSGKAAGADTHEKCLLAMARAVQSVGMYGVLHPSAKYAVDSWYTILAHQLRMRGVFSVGTDGQVSLVDGVAHPTTNPVVLSLLRRLYTTRAGKLQLLSGFKVEDASKMAKFLSEADETSLVANEHSFETWVERNRIRHVRVSQIEFRELNAGDRVVTGDRPDRDRSSKPASAAPGHLKPDGADLWTREFQHQSDRASQTGPLPRKVKDRIATHLRGREDAAGGEDLAGAMVQAAKNADQLAELILKVALVEQEIGQREDEGVGTDVVTCLRSAVSALQRAPEAETDEGWANLARTLSVLEACILQRLEEIAGGSDEDSEAIRLGVQSIQHDLQGDALKREREKKRKALLKVERKIRRFFGSDEEEPVGDGHAGG